MTRRLAHPLRFGLLALALTLCCAAPCSADELSSVELSLVGGEVVGRSEGFGTAEVEIRVVNNSDRQLEGIRVAAYYSATDAGPQPGAQWRIHEFVFEPPLIPGGRSTLRFSDDDAAQYVLVETRRLKFVPALRFNGKLAALSLPVLQQGGSSYLALRDFADAVGASLSAGGGELGLDRGGRSVRLRLGSPEARVNGTARPLTRELLEVNGRAYIAAEDAAVLLGLSMNLDGALDMIELADPD